MTSQHCFRIFFRDKHQNLWEHRFPIWPSFLILYVWFSAFSLIACHLIFPAACQYSESGQKRNDNRAWHLNAYFLRHFTVFLCSKSFLFILFVVLFSSVIFVISCVNSFYISKESWIIDLGVIKGMGGKIINKIVLCKKGYVNVMGDFYGYQRNAGSFKVNYFALFRQQEVLGALCSGPKTRIILFLQLQLNVW